MFYEAILLYTVIVGLGMLGAIIAHAVKNGGRK